MVRLSTVVVLFLLTPFSNAGYDQHETARYVEDFSQLSSRSYAIIDAGEAPQAMLEQCAGQGKTDSSNRATITITPSMLGGTKTLSAVQVSDHCSERDHCALEGDLTLEMDSALVVGALTVRNGAKVLWSDATQEKQDAWLCAGYVVVETGGTWEMNIQDQHKRAWIYIMNNGATHPGLRTRAFGSYSPHTMEHNTSTMSDTMASAVVNKPSLRVIGREMTRTWSLLATPLEVGDTTLQLMHDPIAMGWQVNDRLVVAPTDVRQQGEAQYFSIGSMNSTGQVSLDRGSSGSHQAKAVWTAEKQALLASAEVINLSRNIIITGDDFEEVACESDLAEAFNFGTSVKGCRCTDTRKSCTVGLHTAAAHGGFAEIANVRIEKCGQRGIEGKYCLHFHHMMDCENTSTDTPSNCIFRNNAVETSQQRGLIIHSTHNAVAEANVFNAVRGASIYIEDGNEMHNTVAHNVSICPWTDDEGGCSLPGTSNSQADSAANQAGIYMESPSNHLVGNRMANHRNGQFNDAGNGRGAVDGQVCGNNVPLAIWDGNTFHSSGRFGTYLLGGNFPLQGTGQSIANNGTTNYDDDCRKYTAGGEDNGLTTAILNHFDYANNYVGQYSAGDLQYQDHVSVNNLNNIYWKETKSMQDGCSAHIEGGFYQTRHLALPDALGAFIVEDTILDDIHLGANHHCNVGMTGLLCMPHYVFHDVAMLNGRDTWISFDSNNYTGNAKGQFFGGIFSLSPTNALLNSQNADDTNFILPPGYNSLVSTTFDYLLNFNCKAADELGLGKRYEKGILCPQQLQALKIFSRGIEKNSALKMILEVTEKATGQLLARQQVAHQYNHKDKQGFSFPVIPDDNYLYTVKLSTGEDIPADWIVDFGDSVLSNRWGASYLNLAIQGRDCGASISSLHDRSWYAAADFIDSDFGGWGHGACTDVPDTPRLDCAAVIDPAENLLATNGYTPAAWAERLEQNCPVNGCGNNGACAATYLGSDIGVLPPYACVCKPGYSGDACEISDAIEGGKDEDTEHPSGTVAVTFQVDMSRFQDAPDDAKLYLNGNFNDWCGTCEPMSQVAGSHIWEVTLPLQEGLIEYKFTVNGWALQERFSAQVEGCTLSTWGFINRAFTVTSAQTKVPTAYWNSCDDYREPASDTPEDDLSNPVPPGC